MNIFMGQWNNREGMIRDFYQYLDNEGVDLAHVEACLDGAEIIFAHYTCDCYEGRAFVLYRKGDQYFEVNGSHCSCYGLEGQFDPEETTIAAIRHRLEEGGLGRGYNDTDEFASKLTEALNQLEAA